MRKLFFILASLLILNGCQTISSVNADDYLTATASKPDNLLVGTWTGAAGPYLNTLKINERGVGEYCYSWNDKNVSGKLIFNGEYIIYQTGEKLKVDSFSSNQLNVSSNYYSGYSYKFYKDNELNKAAMFCQSIFKNNKN